MNREQSNEILESQGLDLLPEEERYSPDAALKLTVHIKHDWYSEDSSHGRMMLSSFMSVLSDPSSKIGVLLLSGSAVRMTDPSSDLHDDLLRISRNSLMTGVLIDSIDEYGIDPAVLTDLQITEYTAQDLAFELINAENLITLE